ncbi:MAG TPA: hypothetical protein VFN31_01970 [Candidatus Saccharimonadales bacterium]|nr:hypothetical protein [Candidatus Saccharimonadales bacterium]
MKGSHSIEVVYFAQLDSAEEMIKLNLEDHSTSGWFTEAEAVSLNHNDTDDEVTVIKKGFALLRGEPIAC